MKIDRLIGILTVLLQRKTVTAPYLAEKFKVSRRTINRDIDSLAQAGIPVYTTQGVGGGISIMDGYKIDRTLLTSADMQAILAGLRSLDSVSGTNRYAQLMEKLSAGDAHCLPADNSILIDLGSWKELALSDKIEKIHGAIQVSRKIRFHYHSAKGEGAREIEPYYLIFRWSSWYVMGWCMQRQDWRLFKLNRLTDLQLSDEFEKRNAPSPDFTIEEIYPNNVAVKAIVAPEYKWRLIEAYGEDSFCELPDGNLLFSASNFSENAAVMAWALSLQDGITLLEPKEVRDEMQKFGQRLADRYAEGKQ